MTEENISENLEDVDHVDVENQKIIYITEDSRPDWTPDSTRELLKLYDEKIDMLDTGIISTHKKVWELVSKEMYKREYFFTPAQCENKWKTLKRNYKARLERIEKFGSCNKHFPFESEIAEIISKRPQEVLNKSVNYQPSAKIIKLDVKNDDIFNINLNNPPGFCERNENSNVSPSDNGGYVLQEYGPIVEELSQLRDTVTKSCQYQAQMLKQSTELKQKILWHLENSSNRENNALRLKQARIEQQNEIIKQMRAQNALLQKLLEKMT